MPNLPSCRLWYGSHLSTSAFELASRGEVTWVEDRHFLRFPWLTHAFATRLGGVSVPPAAGLNLSFTECELRSHVEENRRRFFAALGLNSFQLASLRQIHSANVFEISRHDEAGLVYRPFGRPAGLMACAHPPEGDAFLTAVPGILLSIRTADCLPVLLVDPHNRAVAAAHAGWRSALQGILSETIQAMQQTFGTRPADLLVAMGPSIRACCYEVGPEVVSAFKRAFTESDAFFRPAPRADAAYLDLVAVAHRQLREAGVPENSIAVADFCTACRTDLFFSHRKEGNRTGRMMAVIGLRPQVEP